MPHFQQDIPGNGPVSIESWTGNKDFLIGLMIRVLSSSRTEFAEFTPEMPLKLFLHWYIE